MPSRFLSPSNQRLALWVILVCQLMVMLDSTIVNIALHEIKLALGFNDASLSWVVNAYALAFGGALLLGARAGDILGRRRMFLAGMAVFTLASFLGGLAQNADQMLVARAIQGVGAAIASPSALALLMGLYQDARERTRAIGYYTAVSVGGAAVGLVAGGVLTQWASWRWVFFVNVPIGLAALFFGRATLGESQRHVGRFDLAGAVLSTLGITALVYGFVHAASDGWSDSGTAFAFIAGCLLLGVFVLVELRASSPITPLALFANRRRVASYLGRLLLVAAMMGLFFFLSQFTQGVLGYSQIESGLAFLPLTVIFFASSQLSARVWVPRFGAKSVLLAGLAFSFIGLLLMTQLHEHSKYWSLLVPLLVFGAGNGTALVPMTTMSLDDVPPADSGAASGLVSMMQQVGGALGLAVLVTVFGTASKNAAKHVDPSLSREEAAKHIFTTAADKAFVMSAILVAGAWLSIAVLVKNRKKDEVLELERAEIEVDPTLAEL